MKDEVWGEQWDSLTFPGVPGPLSLIALGGIVVYLLSHWCFVLKFMDNVKHATDVWSTPREYKRIISTHPVLQ